MKKILCLFLFILVTMLALVNFEKTYAYNPADTGWTIKEFNSTADIQTYRTVDIIEEIKVDFGNLVKHGIYRKMPYRYSRNGNNYEVRIKVKDVTDGYNLPIMHEVYREGGNIVLKIGDPDKTISGTQTYNISYTIDRVINTIDASDEFYWNITGNEWPVDIENSSIIVNWPDKAQVLDNTCFVGSFGSTVKDCNVSIDDNKYTVFFVSERVLKPGEGMTIVSSVNTGVIENYSIWAQILWFLSDNLGYLIPILVFIFLLKHYFSKGRDPKGKATIAPEFAPPEKLRPALMGTIFDQKVNMHDISATIIDLAVNGYLKIKEFEEKKIFGKSKDYELIKLSKTYANLEKYEKDILDGIFESGDKVKLSDLQNKFYKHIKAIKDDLYHKVEQMGYFEENPEKVRNKYLAIGFVLIFSSFFIPAFLSFIFSSINSFVIALIVSGMLFIIFAFLMPKRTEHGVEVARQIKGFKLYMHTAERYRQKYHEDNKIFEKFLPYAMVFGIVGQWAKKFEKMQIDRPVWYEGRGAFYPVIFANNISAMQNQMNSSLASSPSSAGSGGSGFSGGGAGGGFGGGGGGSW
jgi:uncharacterized membrane protein